MKKILTAILACVICVTIAAAATGCGCQKSKKNNSNENSENNKPGYTIVPTLIFIDQNGRAKVDIALCRGKKMYDKRQTMKEKEDRREMDRAIKHY